MPRGSPRELGSEWGPDFTRGVAVSAILHLAVAGLAVWVVSRVAVPPPLASYTVELTDPAALGGRLAFGPLDRPLGRPRRIAEPAGGAVRGPAQPGEPPEAETAKPGRGSESPKPVAAAKVAEAPPESAKSADSVQAVAPPKPVEPPQPPSVARKAAEAVKPIAPPKAPEPRRDGTPDKPKEPDVSLASKVGPRGDQPKRPETKADATPEPRPRPTIPARPVATVPTSVASPPTTVAPPPARPEPRPNDARVAPQARRASPGTVSEHPPRAPAQPATQRAGSAARKPMGMPDGGRIVPAKPLSPLPSPGLGTVARPPPDVAAAGAGGAGSGGSTEAPVDDEYAAAAERWRSRMAGGMGGMAGAKNQGGPVGDGTNAAGGGGTVVGFEFLSYRQRIFGLIKRNWANALRRSGLVAAVRFEIAPDGTVSGVQLVRSSGDRGYDQSVVRAVQRSSPLPPPPERYRDDFREVVIDFHSEEEGGEGAG
jgi:TonB family protein